MNIPDPFTIPFIFRNRDLTIPANPSLKEWLDLAFKDNPDNLKFLYRRQQRYIMYGGGNSYTWARWITKLERDLIKTKF